MENQQVNNTATTAAAVVETKANQQDVEKVVNGWKTGELGGNSETFARVFDEMVKCPSQLTQIIAYAYAQFVASASIQADQQHLVHFFKSLYRKCPADIQARWNDSIVNVVDIEAILKTPTANLQIRPSALSTSSLDTMLQRFLESRDKVQPPTLFATFVGIVMPRFIAESSFMRNMEMIHVLKWVSASVDKQSQMLTEKAVMGYTGMVIRRASEAELSILEAEDQSEEARAEGFTNRYLANHLLSSKWFWTAIELGGPKVYGLTKYTDPKGDAFKNVQLKRWAKDYLNLAEALKNYGLFQESADELKKAIIYCPANKELAKNLTLAERSVKKQKDAKTVDPEVAKKRAEFLKAIGMDDESKKNKKKQKQKQNKLNKKLNEASSTASTTTATTSQDQTANALPMTMQTRNQVNRSKQYINSLSSAAAVAAATAAASRQTTAAADPSKAHESEVASINKPAAVVTAINATTMVVTNGTSLRRRAARSEQTEEQQSEEDGVDYANAGYIKRCVHLRNLEIENVKGKLFDPETWKCDDCHTHYDTVICLTCGDVGCMAFRKHAIAHNRRTAHPLVLDIQQKTCYCFECKAYILNDTVAGELDLLRQILYNTTFETLKSRVVVDEKITQDDIEETADNHHLMSLTRRYFAMWRQLKDEKTRVREEEVPAITGDKETDERDTKRQRHGEVAPTVGLIEDSDILMQPLFKSSETERIVNHQPLDFSDTTQETTEQQQQQPSISMDNMLMPPPSPMIHFTNNNNSNSTNNQQSGKTASNKNYSSNYLMSKMASSPIKKNGILQGVTGLRNLGNTCFMNTVLQSLSNIPEFRSFFMELKSASTDNSTDPLATGGKLKSETTCANCKSTVSRLESFLELTLDIPVTPPPPRKRKPAPRSRAKKGQTSSDATDCTLEDCFNFLIKSELLEGKIYQCETCKSLQDAHKKFSILTLPNVLCIVLKRFRWKSNHCSKVETEVRFPFELDLTPFVEKTDTPPLQPPLSSSLSTTTNITTNNTNTTQPPTSDSNSYELLNVINHHGAGMFTGHYTAYCFNDLQEIWVHYNDSKATIVEAEDVTDSSMSSAYILFYQRKLNNTTSPTTPRGPTLQPVLDDVVAI
eukprot:gene202-244_t